MFDDHRDVPPVMDDCATPAPMVGAPAGVPGPVVSSLSNVLEPGYPVTREDLLILGRHWFKKRILAEMSCFFEGRDDSDSRAQDIHYQDQMARIGAMLDENARLQIIEEFEAEQRSTIGREKWYAYADGDTEERDRLLDRDRADHKRLSRKLADPAWSGRAGSLLREHPTPVFLDADGDMWYLCELADGEHAGLVLAIVSPTGQSVRAHESVFDRPHGWFRPFGLS
jgi:hypothetical protein